MYVGYLSDEYHLQDILCAGKTEKEVENLLVKTFINSLTKTNVILLAKDKSHYKDVDIERSVNKLLKELFGSSEPTFAQISKVWYTHVLSMNPGESFIDGAKVV